MPFHFSIQRRTFLRRFSCLSHILLSFFDGNTSCGDLVQHHFLDDFPRDAIFSHFFGCVPEETLATPHRGFFDRSKISRIKAL